MKNAGFMATMALALAGGATMLAQEGRPQGSGQSQPQGSTRGADGQQAGPITVTGCIKGGSEASGAGRSATSTYQLVASSTGQRSGATGGAGSESTQRGSTPSAGAGNSNSDDAQNRSGSAQGRPSDSAGAAGQPMTYALEGGDVAKHVGHRVEVTGTVASSASAGSSTSNQAGSRADNQTGRTQSAVGTSGADSMRTLRVTSIRMLAETCAQ